MEDERTFNERPVDMDDQVADLRGRLLEAEENAMALQKQLAEAREESRALRQNAVALATDLTKVRPALKKSALDLQVASSERDGLRVLVANLREKLKKSEETVRSQAAALAEAHERRKEAELALTQEQVRQREAEETVRETVWRDAMDLAEERMRLKEAVERERTFRLATRGVPDPTDQTKVAAHALQRELEEAEKRVGLLRREAAIVSQGEVERRLVRLERIVGLSPEEPS